MNVKDLPRSCIPCEKIEEDCYDWYQRHAAKLEEVKTKRADIVFIGDSITHFFSPEDGIGNGADVWEEFYGRRRVLNLGYGFDRTQNMLWRITHGEMENQDPKLIVINAGTNQFSNTAKYSGDSAEVTFEGVKKLIQTFRELCPAAKIVVMGIFPRGGMINNDTKQQRIDRVNELLADFVNNGTDTNIMFMDLKEKLVGADGLPEPRYFCADFCHPASAGYRVWAEALEKVIVELGL